MRTSHENPEASALSGGNLQKFVVGRELDRDPRVVVIDQPTWGVDAGAAALIRQALVDMARAGVAVLVVSQDLDEIFEIADRIAVISRGGAVRGVPGGHDRPRAHRPADGRGARDRCRYTVIRSCIPTPGVREPVQDPGAMRPETEVVARETAE